MRSKPTLLAAAVCAFVFSISQLSHGQATGSFSGTISDKSGSVIAGAKVTVTAQSTGLTREGRTDDTGHYLIPLLPVSNYTLHVEAPGFQQVDSKDVRLQVDEHR